MARLVSRRLVAVLRQYEADWNFSFPYAVPDACRRSSRKRKLESSFFRSRSTALQNVRFQCGKTPKADIGGFASALIFKGLRADRNFSAAFSALSHGKAELLLWRDTNPVAASPNPP
jgi:hypothetical protein